MPAMVSACCRSIIYRDPSGLILCSHCWATVPEPQRDLIAWLFPTEQCKRPSAEPVFVRYGRKVEVLRPGAVRGHPDGWFWIDA